MDNLKVKDLWAIVMSVVGDNIAKLSFANEVFDSIRDRMKGILDNPEKLIEFLCQHLKPKEFERQENGEVFTPPSLINEKFDKLTEAYPEVWSNPNLKFLDPANGIGNYPALAYGRLMVGLESVFPDAVDRKKHILENMLYMCELEPKNVEVCRKLFDENSEYKLNLFQGSFFDLDPLKEWGVERFDIIMGNPPYNSGGIRSSTGKKLTKGKKTETIWPKFVDISLNMLKEGGYLVFVHPLSWLKTSHSQHDRLLEKHIVWMMLWDNIKSLSTLNGKIPVSSYILHNVNNTGNTTSIKSIIQSKQLKTESSVFLKKEYSVPLAFHGIFEKIIKKIEADPSLKLQVETSTVKAEGKSFKLPETYSGDDALGIDTYRLKDGYFVKKMKIVHKDTASPKLIIANKSSFKGVMIDDGKMGLVGNHKFYVTGDDLDILKLFFETNLASVIAHYTKYGQDFLDKDAFTYIPDVRKISEEELPEITDECLNKYFDFTDEEIAMIQTL
jgi:Eco57I restriction-modification methylase